MHYKPPKVNNRSQWVPIVVKNKDWLVGYISGINLIETLVINSLEENGININLRGLDLCLDSSRFNDIMENGKRESSCTAKEIKNYYKKIIQEKIDMVEEEHPENNDKVFSDCFLEVECVCGLGVYTFKSANEIPNHPLKCQICGRIIIDYTDHDDDEFEYDGDYVSRIDNIFKELNEKIENEDEDEDNDEF